MELHTLWIFDQESFHSLRFLLLLILGFRHLTYYSPQVHITVYIMTHKSLCVNRYLGRIKGEQFMTGLTQDPPNG